MMAIVLEPVERRSVHKYRFASNHAHTDVLTMMFRNKQKTLLHGWVESLERMELIRKGTILAMPKLLKSQTAKAIKKWIIDVLYCSRSE